MPVGFRQGRFEDPARTNWDGSAPRPLSWAAWYPASDDASERELFTSPPAAPGFSIGPAAPDAPIGPARRRYPVVLLSHGTGGTVMHLEWLARDLAHGGFIAIGVDHHGNTAAEPYRAEGFLCWWERARDLTVLLDRIDASGAFAGHVDMNRVFVAAIRSAAARQRPCSAPSPRPPDSSLLPPTRILAAARENSPTSRTICQG
jgi:predicted dienelactone hydrolase